MSMTPEAKVKLQIKKLLKEEKIYYAMPIGSGFGNTGVPDFLCCVQGEFLAVEAKANGNKPTELQLKNMKEIRDSGGMAVVITDQVNDIQYLREIIKRLKEAQNGR